MILDGRVWVGTGVGLDRNPIPHPSPPSGEDRRRTPGKETKTSSGAFRPRSTLMGTTPGGSLGSREVARPRLDENPVSTREIPLTGWGLDGLNMLIILLINEGCELRCVFSGPAIGEFLNPNPPPRPHMLLFVQRLTGIPTCQDQPSMGISAC